MEHIAQPPAGPGRGDLWGFGGVNGWPQLMVWKIAEGTRGAHELVCRHTLAQARRGITPRAPAHCPDDPELMIRNTFMDRERIKERGVLLFATGADGEVQTKQIGKTAGLLRDPDGSVLPLYVGKAETIRIGNGNLSTNVTE